MQKITRGKFVIKNVFKLYSFKDIKTIFFSILCLISCLLIALNVSNSIIV